MSVHAKPNIVQDALHCPIKLNGIDPEKTIYINQPPPSTPSSNSQLMIIDINYCMYSC